MGDICPLLETWYGLSSAYDQLHKADTRSTAHDLDNEFQTALHHPSGTPQTLRRRALLIQNILQRFSVKTMHLVKEIVSKNVDRHSTTIDGIDLTFVNPDEISKYSARLRSLSMMSHIQTESGPSVHIPLAALLSYNMVHVYAQCTPSLGPELHRVRIMFDGTVNCRSCANSSRLYFMGDNDEKSAGISHRPEMIMAECITLPDNDNGSCSSVYDARMIKLARLFNSINPRKKNGGSFPMDKSISSILHEYGIRCRYLNTIRTKVRSRYMRERLLQEIVYRCVKTIIRRRAWDQSCQWFEPIRSLILPSLHDQWAAQLIQLAHDKFGASFTYKSRIAITKLLSSNGLLCRVLVSCGYRSSIDESEAAAIRRSLLENAYDDLEQISARVKLIAPCQGNSDLKAMGSSLRRWIRSISRSKGYRHRYHEVVLGKLVHVYAIMHTESPQTAFDGIATAVRHLQDIVDGDQDRCHALAQAAVVLSNLGYHELAFTSVVNLTLSPTENASVIAVLEGGRGLLCRRTETLMACSKQYDHSSLPPNQPMLVSKLDLIDSLLDLKRFHSASDILTEFKSWTDTIVQSANLLIRYSLVLAGINMALNDYNGLTGLLEQTVMIAKRDLIGSDRTLLISALQSLADLQANVHHRYGIAASLLESALVEARKLYGPDTYNLETVRILLSLSNVSRAGGRLEKGDHAHKLAASCCRHILNISTITSIRLAALVQLGRVYNEVGSKASHEIWQQAWKTASSGNANIIDLLEVSREYSRFVDSANEKIDLLQTAANAADQGYGVGNEVSTAVTIELIEAMARAGRIEDASTVLIDLGNNLPSLQPGQFLTSNILYCLAKSDMLESSYDFLAMKLALSKTLSCIESVADVHQPFSPDTVFSLISALVRSSHRIGEFDSANRIVQRAVLLYQRLYRDRHHIPNMLHLLSAVFAKLQRFDIERAVVVEAWEISREMAFDETGNRLGSFSLRVKDRESFLVFARITIDYVRILGRESMPSLVFAALDEVVLFLGQDENRPNVANLLMMVRQAYAHELYKIKDPREGDILELMLKSQGKSRDYQTALNYARLALAHGRSNRMESRLLHMKSALSILNPMVPDANALRQFVMRSFRRQRIDTNLYDDKYNYDPGSKSHPIRWPIVSPDRLVELRKYLLFQLKRYDRGPEPRYDFVAMTLIEVGEICHVERLFTKSAMYLKRAQSLIADRRLSIVVPNFPERHVELNAEKVTDSSICKVQRSSIQTGATPIANLNDKLFIN
uniref:CLU central domain-containing protein n=2 Tax=Spongospora subterranea TaxID=70186 RepID=A0A0H5RTA5_9EUKA|eukprot:CRZ11969.1 hypothetical protein [Spongospora subterranea]